MRQFLTALLEFEIGDCMRHPPLASKRAPEGLFHFVSDCLRAVVRIEKLRF